MCVIACGAVIHVCMCTSGIKGWTARLTLWMGVWAAEGQGPRVYGCVCLFAVFVHVRVYVSLLAFMCTCMCYVSVCFFSNVFVNVC